jgi:hypothetical protein
MGKIKDEIQTLFDTCERKYQEGGAGAVIDYINEAMRQGQDMVILNVVYERCNACDADMPSLNHICLVCGQPTVMCKQQLVDAVIEDLKKGFAQGDYTVLDELLNKLQIKTLVQALPEERWNEFKELNNSYFEIMHQDYYEEAGFEEIQIHCGEHGSVYLKQDGDKLGFIIDVYGQNDIVDTMTVWEEDLDDGEEGELCTHGLKIPTGLLNNDNKEISVGDIIEDEPFDPNNFSMVEKEDFIDEWGQYTDEVCAELGYDEKTSDDLLMVDYFFHAESRKWIPKISSLYSEREQAIADYLRLG